MSNKKQDIWKSRGTYYLILIYVDDFQFERIWNQINRYLDLFKKFDGVILPDFSVYRDMPLVMQKWNIYRSRAIGNYLQSNGIKVIPNIRYGDGRTYDTACAGISKNSIVAIGTNGCIKDKTDRKYTDDGFEVIIKKITPKVVIIYGGVTKRIEEICSKNKIKIVNFKSDTFSYVKGGR